MRVKGAQNELDRALDSALAERVKWADLLQAKCRASGLGFCLRVMNHEAHGTKLPEFGSNNRI